VANLTSSLTIKLIDGVSGPAKTVANALKTAENNAKAVAKAMSGSGARDGFQRQLAGLKLAGKDIEQVAKAWKDYAKSAGLAANASAWTKDQTAGVRAWERQTVAALRAVKKEQVAFNKSLGMAGGVSPMMAAMSQGSLANQRMIAGMSSAAAPKGQTAAIIAGAGRKGAGLVSGVRDAASWALPGYAGMALGMGGGAAVGGLLGGAAVGYSAKQAISFEKAMADVKKKVNLDAGATWGDVEGMINKNARDFGIAREDMAALAAQAGQAGIAYKDLSGFMKLAAKTSVAWDVSAAEASERLSKIKAATQWTIPQLTEFADKVNTLGDQSASAERDIAEMFSRSAAAAKAANVPLDTTLAVTTALASTGMQEEVASRFWNAFSAKVRMAGTAGKETAAAYKQLGLNIKDVDKGMKTDATATILDVLRRLEKSPDKAAIGVKLFGEQWWDEAARAGQTLPEIARLLDLIKQKSNWSGSLNKTLAVELETTANHLERFKALTSEIGDSLSRWALPPINTQLDKIIKSFETAKATGFLPGPDGLPIDRLKDKTPVPFGAENRARFLPKAGSVAAYESRLGLGDQKTYLPSMLQDPKAMSIQVKPTVDTSSLDAAKGAAEGTKAAVEGLAITVSPNVNTGSIEAAEAAAQSLLSILHEISGAASGATGQVNALSAAAGVAASKVGNLKAVQNSNFTASSQKGE
jgi:TP901 family phage tail tape measure protein